MKEFAKRAAGAALTTAAVVASLAVGTTTASAAPSITPVPCGPSEYVQLTLHSTTSSDYSECFANAGTFNLVPIPPLWVTRISTGNNRVQWYGDGKWQPDQPIGKNTVFTWPHYPGGVSISEIRIL